MVLVILMASAIGGKQTFGYNISLDQRVLCTAP